MKKIFLSFIFLSLSFAQSESLCNVGNLGKGFGDWFNLSIIALFISIGFISLYFMYGSISNNEEIKAKCQIEYIQILLTALVIVLIVPIINFACNDAAGRSLGINENLIDYTEKYFKLLQNYSIKANFEAFKVFSVMALFSSFEPPGKTPFSVGLSFGVIESVDLLKASYSFLFSILQGSYIITIANRFIIYYSVILSLYYFIPLGIVMRSFFPIRRFGGGLLGIGISLIIFLPLLFALNALILSSYFSNKISEFFPEMSCKTHEECYSKVCDIEMGVCVQPLKDNEVCFNESDQSHTQQIFNTMDLRCASGRCIIYQTYPLIQKCAMKEQLLPKGSVCRHDNECMVGTYCNASLGIEGICRTTKEIGESCSRHRECEKGRGERACINNICNITKSVGEDCSDDYECSSLYCKNGKCEESKMSFEVIDVEKIKEANVGRPPKSFLSNLIGKMFSSISMILLACYALPLINYMFLGFVMRDLSSFFGMGITLEDIYRLI
ncbi:MAG: Dickkopf N-terminal cysteine-rich domain-containing protein [Candidatus Micrarchaeia archaeon]